MKLTDIKNGNLSAEWAEKGYELPKFDVEAVKAKTHAEPTWVHFGAGNIFRAFPAAILNDALNSGKYDRGVIVAESFDYEIIDKAYQPYDNLSLLVCLKSTGDIEKKVIASVTESLKADYSFGADWARLVEIFQAPSLQMISFTITEKGYGVAPADLERGLTPVLAMGKVTALLYERFKAGKLPLTVQRAWITALTTAIRSRLPSTPTLQSGWSRVWCPPSSWPMCRTRPRSPSPGA